MLYLVAIAVILVLAWFLLGLPYLQAYRRRKELERRGRIKKPEPPDDEETKR